MGGAKVLYARIFLFYRRCAADFCSAPPYGKNQKVDRFIKRLQRKIKLFFDIYLLRFSPSPGKVYVPTDFDTIKIAFPGAKTAEKGIKQGLSRSNTDFGSPCFFVQFWISAVPLSGYTVGVRLAVYGFWNN